LRQPIDTLRFKPHGPPRDRPRRALVLSNNFPPQRFAILERAWGSQGVEIATIGRNPALAFEGTTVDDPRAEISAADIVVGYGRSVLEAMAMGRAAYVYDWHGGSGWVTAETYPAIEGDGIAGRDEETIDATRLRADFQAYEAAMGPVNHDLVIANHRANVHAQELVETFRRLAAPDERPKAPLDEMSRLVRLEWRARVDVHSLRGENLQVHDQLKRTLDELRESHEARVEDARTAEERIQGYERSPSWRLTKPLRGVTALLRRLRGRGRRG
jgi:hypothetical protein